MGGSCLDKQNDILSRRVSVSRNVALSEFCKFQKSSEGTALVIVPVNRETGGDSQFRRG